MTIVVAAGKEQPSQAFKNSTAPTTIADSEHHQTSVTESNSDTVPLNNGTNGSATGNDKKKLTDQDDNVEKRSFGARVCIAYRDNEFLILVIIAILLARAYPPIGADYLYPDITATWLAVCIIFVLAGLSLKTKELTQALKNCKFNTFVQLFNLGVVSSVVFGVSRGLLAINALSQDLADGLVIAASLPMTINMVLVLTKASQGDSAAAVCNAAMGNLLGVFVSPILILGYLGITGDIDLVEVFYKLALRVVLPVAIGQVIQKTSTRIVDFQQRHKKAFKKTQEYILVFIVYTVFCETFSRDNSESNSSIGDIFLTILFVLILLVVLMILAWFLLGLIWRNDPGLRVMGLFGCTHKTVAMGVPLINAMYQGNPAVGLYTLPLLIWHPMQLVIGTFLAPRLAAFVEREEERLGLNTSTSTSVDNNNNNEHGNRIDNSGKNDIEAVVVDQSGTRDANIQQQQLHYNDNHEIIEIDDSSSQQQPSSNTIRLAR